MKESDPAVRLVERALEGFPAAGGVRRLPRAPAGLSAEARDWWRAVFGRYDLPLHHMGTLYSAAKALERVRACRELVDRDGPVILDRFGQQREHPAATAERAYAVLHARLVRELGIDLQLPAHARIPTRWKS